VCVCEHACTCACVRAHVCRAAGAGAGAPGAGAHVYRDPGAVQECRAPGAGAHVCRAGGAGAAAAAGQVLGLVLQVLVLGRGLLRSSLFTHPQNFIFANPGQPRSLKINIYYTIPEPPRRAKNVTYPG